jgi:hypothetical protein
MSVCSERSARAAPWRPFTVVLLVLAGCDLTLLQGPDAAGFPTDAIQPGSVALRIENNSGVGVLVEAVYEKAELRVRRTNLYLTSSGAESVEEVIPTAADRITVEVRLAGGPELPPGLETGGLLETHLFERGVDYQGGETLLLVISALEPIEDCIGNGTPGICEVPGDLNGDGALDHLDIPLFIEVLLGVNTDRGAILRADLNRDGAADGNDIQGLIASFLAAR